MTEEMPTTAFYVELNIDTAGNATQTNGTSFYSWIENVLKEAKAVAWEQGSLDRADRGLGIADNPYKEQS